MAMFLLLATAVAAAAAVDRPRAGEGGPGNFDVRSRQPAAAPQSRAAVARLRRKSPGLELDRVTGTPRFVGSQSGFLTKRERRSAADIALGFVRRNSSAFGLDSGDLGALELARRYTTRSGLTNLDWVQTYRGIPSFDTGLRATVKGGRLVSVSGPAQPDLSAPSSAPRLSATEAMERALESVGVMRPVRQRGRARGAKRQTLFSTGYAELAIFPEVRGARLAWKTVAFADRGHVYLTAVDAGTGAVLRRVNLVKSATGLVHRYFPGAAGAGGTDQPRTFATTPDPWSTTSAALLGDNVHVYSDEDDDLGVDCSIPNCGDPGVSDEIGASGGNWNFPVSHAFGSGPSGRSCPAAGCTWNGFTGGSNWTTNRKQAGTQLFWFVNNFHDYLQADAGIQFDDRSGNFEQSSSGGIGLDRVQAQVDDGAETGTGSPDCDHLNNANMLTLPESAPSSLRGPQMQMYLWTAVCGGIDAGTRDTNGADDASIVYHEYTHGLSNRLVDPNDTGGLSTAQGGAMGEAWSDWYAIDYLVGQGLQADTSGPNINLGGYEVPGGIRRKPIDTPVGSGGFTYGDFGTIDFPSDEPHDNGEIWGETLWDLRRSLVGHYGVAVGERHVRTLVTDGMRISSSQPTFLSMRDAILSANTANGLGDCDRIWAVFAARGMGAGAQTTDPDDFLPIEDFTNPSASRCPHPAPGPAAAPTAPAKASFKRSKKTIRVSRRGRFSFSFTAGPGLKGRITLRTVRRVRAKNRGRKRIATFANKTFTVPGSGKVKLRFKLSRRNRTILRRYRKLRIKVTVKLRNSANLTSRATVRITLKAPRRRKP